MSDNNILLSVRNLSTFFDTENGTVKAVQDVCFDIKNGETFALVGESGCGKSVTALSIMRLVPKPAGAIASGEILLKSRNILKFPEKQMRRIRGNKIAMIFQEPMTSLNPVFTIGTQITEAISLHQKKYGNEAKQLAKEMLAKVRISEPGRRMNEYPHQFSGGMRQRVMIAMAISCKPSLLIADEPTTALDVTIQAQILDLLDELQQSEKMSILLITHDLGIVAQRADYVAVMYASKIVEKCSCVELFKKPLHPYTKGLLNSLPQLGAKQKRLNTIAGNVPEPLNFPSGCKFHPRCHLGCNDKRCQSQEPALKQVSENHYAACWYAEGYEK
ncbi:MAG: ABC transporter ATP-binding protein [Planctomycetes bacterium]|nr:ABC transporter ATP-binding protein [Planctomycetota bacterium]MBU1518215.1 ABC transporter ATP-binding protein [Planctomycetota bacterium]MBU2457119.1 ABC transporter ATP-binding protein [Planctomycetota bacterium]MBU2597146.1 ABC transporter ATP-binding protein [Planctomycetota bacterium]